MDSGDLPANMEFDAGVDLMNENGEGMVHMDDGDINDLEDVLGGMDGEKHLGNGLDIDLESDFHSQLNDLNRSSGVGLSKPIWSQPDDENGPLNGTANGHDMLHEDNIPEDIEGGGGEGFIDPDMDIATEGSLDLDVEERGDIEPEEELDFEVPDNHHHMNEPYMPLGGGLNFRDGEPEPSEQEPLQDQMQEQEQDPLEEQLGDSPEEEETLQDPPTECFYDEMGEPYQSPVHEPFTEPYQEQIQDNHHEQVELREPFQDPEQDPIQDPPEETVQDRLQEPFEEPLEEAFVDAGQEPLQAPSPEPFYDPVQERDHDHTPIISEPVPSTQEPVRDPRNEPSPQEPLLTERYQGDGDVEIPAAMEHQHFLPDDDILRDDEAGAMTEGSLDLDVAVGEHVEEDDDADVFENTERYESPTPPTYVNTTIVSNASSSLEPAPAHAQCLIARSQDDVNGDVMVQDGGGSGRGSGRIPTRVDDIAIAVEPTAESKLLDHKGNGDAYVPLEVVRKGFPPPFPIGYSDENLQKGNWGHKMEFMCAIFCVIFNIDSFIQFPYMMSDNGGVVFLIPYMIILFLLVLPLILSEISLGQFASSSFLTCWKFCPLLKGLSIGMLLQLFGLAFMAGPFSSHSLYYIYSVFLGSGDQIIYTACGNDWNAPVCKSFIPPPVAGNVSLGNYTTMPATMVLTDFASYGTDGTDGMMNGTYELTSPEEQYYSTHVKMQAMTTQNLGAPIMHLMICLGVAWAIAFFIMLFGIKSFGKVAYMLVGFHILLLFVLLVRGAVLDGALDGVKLLFWPEVDKLLDAQVWSRAMQCAMLTFMPMCGIYMSLGGYSKFHNNCFMDSVVLILVALFINLLSAVTFFTYVGYGNKLLDRKVLHISDHSTGDTIFVTLAMLISTLPHARIVSFILFFFSFLSSLGVQIVVALSIVIGFLDAIGCRHSWKTVVPASLLVCVACFGGGLLFITPEGPHFWWVLYRYFLPHIPFIMSIIVPLALTWVYGTIPQWKFLRFQRDIKCMVGCFPIVFQGLFAGLEALVVPLVMGVAWVFFLYIIFSKMDLMYEAYQGWHIAVAIIIAFVPLIIGFLSGAVMELCKHLAVYRYFTELFWLASMPLREWGPAVDELREEHGYPPLNKEERDDLVEEYRENAYGSQNINNANDNNSSSEVRIQPLQQGRSGGLYTPTYSQGGGSYPPSPRDKKQEMIFAEDRSTSNDLDQSERDNPVNSNATLLAGTPLLGLSLCSHETTL